MNNKIKAAHVIRVFSYGGAEVLLRECFSHPLFKEQVESDLYVLDHKKLGLVPEVQPHLGSVRHYKIRSIFFLFEYIKFLRHIARGKYDIVHAHLPVAAWMTIPAKIFCRNTKFIYTEHNLVTFYAKCNYYLSGFSYRFFDCIIYVSEEVGEVVRKEQKAGFFKPKAAVTILNGIDTQKFSNAHRAAESITQQFTVGLVARFRPQKRVDRWVEVAAAVCQLKPDTKFLMVGDGPDDETLRTKIQSLDLGKQIELSGMLADTVAAFRRIDIFLLTSDFEGLPLVVMEAMSSGCVPILSNVGGIRQLDFEGFGYKYDAFNAQRIAEIITAYASNPARFKMESLKAREFVEKNYSLTKQVNEILNLYRKLI